MKEKELMRSHVRNRIIYYSTLLCRLFVLFFVFLLETEIESGDSCDGEPSPVRLLMVVEAVWPTVQLPADGLLDISNSLYNNR